MDHKLDIYARIVKLDGSKSIGDQIKEYDFYICDTVYKRLLEKINGETIKSKKFFVEIIRDIYDFHKSNRDDHSAKKPAYDILNKIPKTNENAIDVAPGYCVMIQLSEEGEGKENLKENLNTLLSSVFKNNCSLDKVIKLNKLYENDKQIINECVGKKLDYQEKFFYFLKSVANNSNKSIDERITLIKEAMTFKMFSNSSDGVQNSAENYNKQLNAILSKLQKDCKKIVKKSIKSL